MYGVLAEVYGPAVVGLRLAQVVQPEDEFLAPGDGPIAVGGKPDDPVVSRGSIRRLLRVVDVDVVVAWVAKVAELGIERDA